MTTDDIRRELERFDTSLPLDEAWTPPASWYTDPRFYRAEQRAVFGSNWIAAGRLDQLGSPGNYVSGELAGEPYVVVRGSDERIRAFYNVCRHHAAAVASGEGSTDRFVCPYHGWTYGLDGRLTRAPELGGAKDFDRDDFGLVPLAVTPWGPFVWISLAGKPRPLSDDLKELESRFDAAGFRSLRFVRSKRYTVRCNWKVYVDNYLDGGYHVAHVHHGLAAQLDLKSYRTEIFERYSIQSSAGATAGAEDHPIKAAEGGGDFSERIGEGALYAWVYPNFMINRYGPVMDTNLVLPRGPDRTEVIFDFYFLQTGGREAGDFIERSIAASDTVQQEDMEICASVQRGLQSRSYDRGRYSVKREMGEHHFHRLLAADLQTEFE